MTYATRHIPLTTDFRRTRFGMTLLELIVALTLFAFIAGMAATLWAQARAWTEENAAAERSVRTHRAADFAQRQWADRRTGVGGFLEDSVAVVVTPARLEFVTASPALFPDWPLVRAAYIIKRDEDFAGLPEEAPSRLVYEELRLTRLDEIRDEALDSVGEVKKESITLLDDCRNLRWERWGAEEVLGRLESVFGVPEGVNPWISPERAISEDGRAGEEGAAESESPRSGSAAETEDNDGPREALRAVRLRGVHKDREFTWVFVGADSR